MCSGIGVYNSVRAEVVGATPVSTDNSLGDVLTPIGFPRLRNSIGSSLRTGCALEDRSWVLMAFSRGVVGEGVVRRPR